MIWNTQLQQARMEGQIVVNYWLLIAAAIAIGGGSLHFYTFEVWIWPKLHDDCFPSFPFGPPAVVKGFYRQVWHFFTVNFIVTVAILIGAAFAYLAPFLLLMVWYLIIFWALIVATIFIVAAVSLEPGQSYIQVMVHAFQWVMLLLMILFMYLGATWYPGRYAGN
jgi:hypothetical protein